jgi:hypothetical protein
MQAWMTSTSDRIGGVIWALLGAAIVYGSWTMDRLQSLQAPPLTAPGLVPGLLGLGLIVLGAILILRRASVVEPAQPEAVARAPANQESTDWHRVFVSWLLCITYAGVLLGRGVPYWVLTAAFLFLHLLLIREDPSQRLAGRLLTAALLSVIVSAVVGSIFQYVFLVRLP